jgi:hypothetical protein
MALGKKPRKRDRDSLRYHNGVFARIAKKAGLNADQRRRLHNKISKKGYDPEEIEEMANAMGKKS